jgi:hypothetical protein
VIIFGGGILAVMVGIGSIPPPDMITVLLLSSGYITHKCRLLAGINSMISEILKKNNPNFYE